jgi:hypothetical protein
MFNIDSVKLKDGAATFSYFIYRIVSLRPTIRYIVGIAIPGQFPNPGIRDWRGRDPGIPEYNAHVIRDSNPGPTFSIPGFRD